MINRHLEEVRKIVDAVTIDSSTSFRVQGEAFEVNCLDPNTSNHHRYLASPLAHDLQQALYDRFYTCLDAPADESDDASPPDLLRKLRAANAANDEWDRGWKILDVARHGVYAAKGMWSAFLPHGLFAMSERYRELKPHAFVDARRHAESTKAQSGFYFGYSNLNAPTIGKRKSIRFYWNCNPEGAQKIFQEVSTRFHRFQIPYEIKCLGSPRFYRRRDSLVLYLKPPFLRAAFEQVKRIYPLVQAQLEASVPLFTRAIAPGLAIAETPPGDTSFGVHRCGLIAQALVRAFDQQITDGEKRQQLVREEFTRHHISLERPWRNHGEQDPFGIDELHLP